MNDFELKALNILQEWGAMIGIVWAQNRNEWDIAIVNNKEDELRMSIVELKTLCNRLNEMPINQARAYLQNIKLLG